MERLRGIGRVIKGTLMTFHLMQNMPYLSVLAQEFVSPEILNIYDNLPCLQEVPEILRPRPYAGLC